MQFASFTTHSNFELVREWNDFLTQLTKMVIQVIEKTYKHTNVMVCSACSKAPTKSYTISKHCASHEKLNVPHILRKVFLKVQL